jgi:hypothetical protein
MRAVAGLSLIAAMVLAGCDSMITKPTLYSNVLVDVRRLNHQPVPGVPVVLYTGQRPMGYGITDSTGHYLFTNVPKGLYGVRISPYGDYVAIEDVIGGPVTVVKDQIVLDHDTTMGVHFDVLKRGPGNVAVYVRNPDGTPIPNVSVEIYDPQRVNARGTTDPNGLVPFENIPFGSHGIRIIRPPLYRDFEHINDSLFTTRDGIVVDEGSAQTFNIPITRCAAPVIAKIVDQNGAPVPLTTAALYDAVHTIKVDQSDAAGQINFGLQPCAWDLAITINPPVGYTVGQGRGQNVIDGIRVTNGVAQTVTFTVRKS